MKTNTETLYEEIDRQQAVDNFLLKKGKNGRRTVIFFSSNGLVLDDPQDVKRVVESNAYEWMNISEGMDCNLIFVRDLKKSWYLCGINNELNSVDKLLGKLRELSSGTEVITVGSSAGGSAAILFGCLLNAEAVIAFSCQFTIEYVVEELSNDCYRYLYEYSKHNSPEYYNLSRVMNSHKAVPIFYFYPAYSEIDKRQYGIASSAENVKIFYVKASGHGYVPSAKSLQALLNMNKNALLAIHEKFGAEVVPPYVLEYRIVGLIGAMSSLFTRVVRKICRKRQAMRHRVRR